ncbi:sigma-70 family RNA polymerase sigma factor [Aquimarina aggregata]|uniref:sigma-70 family RNA polymerase sigma factor n=1 Tax=Aquimarina aggregata TaxID=1642818 RepID=UPI00249040BE|nr:sigma-70 family RNA polymerase sigma factor [Aquimarina aggregata]
MKIKKYKQVWELWEAYENALKRYVFKLTKHEQITEDVVQDTLLKVHKSCCSDKEISNVRSWLFQIAHNSLMDFFNSSKKEKEIPYIPIPDDTSDIYSALSGYVEPLIGFLPDTYAQALRMADIDGLKQQEIADMLGLSLTATKSRIQRARKLLKKEIYTCFHTEESKTFGLADFNLKDNCTTLQNLKKKNK